MKNKILISLFVLSIAFAFVGFASAQPINQTDCSSNNTQTWITQPGVYYLQNNISDSNTSNSGACFYIESSNVDLEGNGFTINGTAGTGVYSGNGNLVYSNETNITINNLTIKGFEWGVYFDSINNSVISNNIVNSNQDSISLDTASANDLIENNIVTSSAKSGISLYNKADNNSLIGNTANLNGGSGILIDNSYDNLVSNNIAKNNYYYGIISQESSYNNQILNNTAYGNAEGITLIGTNNNVLSSNLIYQNSNEGMLLSNTTNNSFSNDILFDNSWLNFGITHSSNNSFSNETINSSAGNSIYADSFSSGNLLNINYNGNYSLIESPNLTSYTDGNVPISVDFLYTGYCLYSIDSGITNNTLSSSDNISLTGTANLGDGNYDLTVFCNDTQNNIYTSSVNFNVDIPVSSSGIVSSGGGGYPPYLLINNTMNNTVSNNTSSSSSALNVQLNKTGSSQASSGSSEQSNKKVQPVQTGGFIGWLRSIWHWFKSLF